MAEHIVGLAWDDEVVRAAELKVRGRRSRIRVEVVRASTIELAPGVVEHGEVVDTEAFARSLRTLWADGGFSTKRVAVGLDARATVIRRAELPALDQRDFEQAAAFEVSDLLNYPLTDALISVLRVDPHGEARPDSSHALILATKQQVIVDAWEAVRDAGLRPVSTQLIQAALVSSISEPDPLPEGTIGVMVDVSELVTNVMIHDTDGLLMSRVVTAGVGAEASLSDELQMELEMLAGFGAASGVSEAESGPADASPEIATVMEGVTRTIGYYTGEVDSRPIARIVLCGAQCDVAGLAHGLAGSFPSARVFRHAREQWPEDHGRPNEFDEAVAVAHAATARAGRAFDLVPRVRREGRVNRISLALGVAASVAVAPVLLGDALERRDQIVDEERIAEGIERSVDQLRGEVLAFDDDVERVTLALEQGSRVETLLEEDLPMGAVVQQVAEAMPDDTFLLALRLSRAGPDEAPTGYGGPPPEAMLTLTGVAGDLDGVGRWMQSVQEVPVLDGVWLAQSSIGPYDTSERVGAVFTIDAVVVGVADPDQDLEVDP